MTMTTKYTTLIIALLTLCALAVGCDIQCDPTKTVCPIEDGFDDQPLEGGHDDDGEEHGEDDFDYGDEGAHEYEDGEYGHYDDDDFFDDSDFSDWDHEDFGADYGFLTMAVDGPGSLLNADAKTLCDSANCRGLAAPGWTRVYAHGNASNTEVEWHGDCQGNEAGFADVFVDVGTKANCTASFR